ncbi:MAG: hypothetical protein WBA10_15055, partial [Elainellaceae cyanobacterium]
MQALKKILAGFFLLAGLPILFVGAADLLDSDESREAKEGALAAIGFFGLPSVAIAAGLLVNLRQQEQRQHQQSTLDQEQFFLQLLHQQSGEMSVVDFALAAKIPIDDAKEYLDQKAKQLDASFE